MSQKQNGTLPKQARDFQSIVKNERVQRGWSQADVAKKIGSDPKTAEFHRPHLRHPDNGRFRRYIIGLPIVPTDGNIGRGRYDTAVMLFLHNGRDSLRAIEDTRQVDPDDIIPLLFRHLK